MRAEHATTRRPWQWQVFSGLLALLALAGIGPPGGQAQLTYNGGVLETPRRPPSPSPRPAPVRRPVSFSPDNDFYYLPYAPAPAAVTRSYYPGPQAGRSVSPSPDASPIAAVLPWEQAGFQGYEELEEITSDSALSAPRKYAFETTRLLRESPTGGSTTATLIVHLPEHALLWIEGTRKLLKEPASYFESPPLEPGEKYHYTVRVAWLEKGRWVGQSRKVAVEPGSIHALYLRRVPKW